MTREQLISIREYTKLNQEDFAVKLGYASKSTISMKESGERRIQQHFSNLVEKTFKRAFTKVMG